MRILLVQPAPFEDNRLGLENTFWLSEPVGLTSIGTMVQDEHEVLILDMRLEEPAKLPETLRNFKPDLVGTTAMTTDAYQAKAVMMLAKQILPSCLTVMGGHHATFMPEFYDEAYVDVVQGEGELTFQDLVDLVGRARRRRSPAPSGDTPGCPSPHAGRNVDRGQQAQVGRDR